jgi:putative DNA methylase
MPVATKKELLSQDVSRAVGAGKPVALETVDFNDPNRPKTCLEVDFPILPVNQVAIIEGNAGKPIYQMSKWWARRRSSVFRSMLIAAATKAPEDTSLAAKLVWENYYSNHQKKGAFKDLKVADIFMGGGTTLVEGSRLGMQMSGNDLNPVAWFVVKQEMAKIDLDEARDLLANIEAVVKPQLMSLYYCDGPKGEKGRWTHKRTGKVMDTDFDPLQIPREQRSEYDYEGSESIYTFWAKHGPCQVTGCGHRTPIMTTPVIAIKSLSVKHWERTCKKCGANFHVEDSVARMAPGVPISVAPTEPKFSTLDPKRGVVCPDCDHSELVKLGKGKSKKVELTLLIHPQWLVGSPKADDKGQPYGGSTQDDFAANERWLRDRASKLRLVEVRGTLPSTITCPETSVEIKTGKEGGTVPKTGNFACAKCGTVQPIVTALEASKKTAPIAPVTVQGFSKALNESGNAYGGRFFIPATDVASFQRAEQEWRERSEGDLSAYWPRSDIPFGHMTHQRQPLPQHGYTRWADMFNCRQLLVHAQLLKAILTSGRASWETREFVLGAFQQYLRNQSQFTLWNAGADKLEPMFANNNYHPKAMVIENSVFANIGRGNWTSCAEGIIEGRQWAIDPWDTVSVEALKRVETLKDAVFGGKSEKARPGDPVRGAAVSLGSSTNLDGYKAATFDLVVTDPPFGGLLHYSELAEFFYVWLRLALKDRYPKEFGSEFAPKSLEVVANKARQPDDPDAFYQRLLTECWREAFRILKPGGILAFTFHHSEDDPWVAVLESLFDAGFYLEATYPIRSDETKGDGEFGSKTIEYDIVHVCRKRTEDSTPVSWARMRREVLQDVRQIEAMLGNHARAGLPAADIQVIRRGKALEYFSRHYGKVFVEEGRSLSVAQALVGINQLIEEETDVAADLPPVNAEPLTRQFLRIFRGKTEVDRDQLQKFLKGTGVSPEAFEEFGWSFEEAKRFNLVSSKDFAQRWKGRQRKSLTHDYDQAWFLIGACHDGTGINASEQLRNDNFKPHPALKPLLDWFSRNGIDANTRQAAIRAGTIYNAWADSNQDVVSKQMEMFA